MSQSDFHFGAHETTVLAVDTATRAQSIALVDGPTVLADTRRRVRFNHGSSLLVHISQMLDDHDLAVADLDLIAAGLGPGSFTGLRVGLAIAKSLARTEDIPIVGVSTLATLAFPIARSHPGSAVCPMYDARRQEIYTGVYTHQDGRLRADEPDRADSAGRVEQTVARLADGSSVVIVGDAPRTYESLADWSNPAVTVMPAWADAPSAVATALLGRRQARRGRLADIAALEPNYIRPTDAEAQANA